MTKGIIIWGFVGFCEILAIVIMYYGKKWEDEDTP